MIGQKYICHQRFMSWLIIVRSSRSATSWPTHNLSVAQFGKGRDYPSPSSQLAQPSALKVGLTVLVCHRGLCRGTNLLSALDAQHSKIFPFQSLRHFPALLIAASLVIIGANSIPGLATSSVVQISFPNRFEQVPLRINGRTHRNRIVFPLVLDAVAKTSRYVCVP